jgi:hypothetical protein
MPSQALIDAMLGGQKPDTVSEEDSYRDMFARDPALAGQMRLFGGEPSRPELGGSARVLLSMLPVSGNIIAAQDAWDSAKDVGAATNEKDRRLALASTILNTVGALSPLPFGRMAGRAAEGAASRTNIFAGPMAKTADHEALAKAQEMAATGGHPQDIWRDTGWLQGPDGKWRFEIDDSGAKVSFGEGLGVSGGPLQHSAVAEAYPGLSEMRTSVNPGESPGDYVAFYDRARNGQPAELRARGRDPDDRRLPSRSNAIHELQHAVDDQEGLLSPAPYKNFQEAYQSLPERMAREAQYRMDMLPAARRSDFPKRLFPVRDD